ncbi:MAG: hypothetical protein Q7R95_04035 [bacterium]|nr:hypothetical protein [bacterium]
MKSKYGGIDSREIKCCCESQNCIESGISFEGTMLNFHFLDYISKPLGGKILHQATKSMKLNKETAQLLVNELKKIK